MKIATELAPQQSVHSSQWPAVHRGPLRRLGSLLAGEKSRRGLAAVVDQGIVSGLSFATSSIIARATGSYGLGIAHLAMTMVIFMMNAQAELTVAPFTVYRSRRRGDDLAIYSGSVLLHQLILTAIGCVGLLVCLLFLHLRPGAAHLAPAVAVLLFVAPFILGHSFLRHLSFAGLRFGSALIMDLGLAVLQLSLLLTLFYLDQLSVPRVFCIVGTACAAASLGWWRLRPIAFRFAPAQAWRHWCENWRFSRWSLLSHLVGCPMIYVLPFLLASVHGESATGRLAACGKLSALAATFVLGISHFLTPTAVSAYAERGISSLLRVLLGTALLLLVSVGGFCAVISLSGDRLLVGLFGADFADTGSIVLVLSLAVLMNSLAVVAGNGMWAVNRPQANLTGDIAGTAAVLITALVLVQPWGPLGIAVATLVGCATGALTRLFTLGLVIRQLHPELCSR